MKKLNLLTYARLSAARAREKKGDNVTILNVRRLTALADYFVFVTADSTPQIRAIIDSIVKTLREEEHIHPIHTEGKDMSSWAILDYGGLVVHVMLPATRDFYALDKRWVDARKISHYKNTLKKK